MTLECKGFRFHSVVIGEVLRIHKYVAMLHKGSAGRCQEGLRRLTPLGN